MRSTNSTTPDSDWDRLRREFVFVTRFGSTTNGIY
jgi:hypothetical protein